MTDSQTQERSPSAEKPAPVEERKYAVLMETSGKEIESWYYFIKYQGNEDALKYLARQLDKVEDMYIIDDYSTFDIDLDHLVSEQTAREMMRLDLNFESKHRKFDGKLKRIDFGFKPHNSDEKKIRKANRKLARGKIELYVDGEEVDSESDSESGSESSASEDERKVDKVPKVAVPRWARAKQKKKGKKLPERMDN